MAFISFRWSYPISLLKHCVCITYQSRMPALSKLEHRFLLLISFFEGDFPSSNFVPVAEENKSKYFCSENCFVCQPSSLVFLWRSKSCLLLSCREEIRHMSLKQARTMGQSKKNVVRQHRTYIKRIRYRCVHFRVSCDVSTCSCCFYYLITIKRDFYIFS